MAGLPMGTDEEIILGRQKTPIVTIGLIVVNVIVYVIMTARTLFMFTPASYIYSFGFIPALLLQNPLQGFARIFTSMFVHANLLHIFFNMYFLYVFGRAVENTIGRWRYLGLYIASGIAAALFHTAFTFLGGPQEMVIPAVGASGAISGVLGAYLILFPGTSLTVCWWFFFLPFCFTLRAAAYLIFWFALQVIEGYTSASLGGAGVAFFAHVGGFLTGIALLPLVVNWARHRYLKMRSEFITRFLDYIRYAYTYVERPGLGRFAKAVLTALIAAVLIGSAVSFAQAYSLQNSYVVKYLGVYEYPSLEPVASYSNVLVGVYPGHLVRLGPSMSYVSVFVNRLVALNFFWDPSWASKVGKWVSKDVVIEGIKVPVRLYLQKATYSSSRLVEASGKMITEPVYIRGGVPELGSPKLFVFDIAVAMMHAEVMQCVAGVAIALSILALYTIYRKSDELTLVS
ncbi:MAG: rhomboid family intramembrane serine protease [Crenarchaeota archaeon]|nr:rhomboid family intramembrane serine protease [Thermoproteota archaeon]